MSYHTCAVLFLYNCLLPQGCDATTTPYEMLLLSLASCHCWCSRAGARLMLLLMSLFILFKLNVAKKGLVTRTMGIMLLSVSTYYKISWTYWYDIRWCLWKCFVLNIDTVAGNVRCFYRKINGWPGATPYLVCIVRSIRLALLPSICLLSYGCLCSYYLLTWGAVMLSPCALLRLNCCTIIFLWIITH